MLDRLACGHDVRVGWLFGAVMLLRRLAGDGNPLAEETAEGGGR